LFEITMVSEASKENEFINVTFQFLKLNSWDF